MRRTGARSSVTSWSTPSARFFFARDAPDVLRADRHFEGEAFEVRVLQENWSEVVPTSLQLSLANPKASGSLSFQVDSDLDDATPFSGTEKGSPCAGHWRQLGTARVQLAEFGSYFLGDLELHGKVLAGVTSTRKCWKRCVDRIKLHAVRDSTVLQDAGECPPFLLSHEA